MTAAAFRESSLQVLRISYHIVSEGTVPSLQSVLSRAVCLSPVNHKRVYLPDGALPWPILRRPTRKTDYAQFRSEP